MDIPRSQSAELTEGERAEGKRAEGKRGPWDDPRLPWLGKPRPVDLACWAAIILSGAFYWALLPFRASLIGTHPLWSVLLGGSTEGIISAAAFARTGHGSLIAVLAVSVVGLIKFDAVFWWAGRLWGERVITLFSGKSKRSVKYMDRVRRHGRRFTWPAMLVSAFAPIPHSIIYAIAGWTRMRLVTFLILDAISSLAWAGLMAGLGYAIGKPAVNVAKEISHYGLYVTIALIVVIVFFSVRSQRRMLAGARAEAGDGAEAGKATQD